MKQADMKEVYAVNKINDWEQGEAVHFSSCYTQQDINTSDEFIVCFLGQQRNHLYLLQTHAGSVSAFMNCLKLLGAAERALVMLFYQFSRRVEENGCAGTDCGTTAPVFVIKTKKCVTIINPDLNNFDIINNQLVLYS